MTDFVLATVPEAVPRTVEAHEQSTLSVRDRQAFVDALLNPQQVNERLKETVGRYREATGV